MPTQRQKKVAKLLVDNLTLDKPLNGGEILEKTGYAPGVIKNPSDILESEGVKEELKNVYGFDPDTAKQVVGQILLKGENDSVKLNAADKIFKVHGSYAAEKHMNMNIELAPSPRLQEIADKLRQANA